MALRAIDAIDIQQAEEQGRRNMIQWIYERTSVPGKAELLYWARPDLRPDRIWVNGVREWVVPSLRPNHAPHIVSGPCTDRLCDIHDAHLQGLHTCDCEAARYNADCWHRWMDDVTAAQQCPNESWSFGYFRPNADGLLVNVQTGETFAVLPPLGGMNG